VLTFLTCAVCISRGVYRRVPGLFLTSAEDVVVTLPAAVTGFAYMQQADRTRWLRCAVLKGAHCMTHRDSAAAWEAAISALVRHARLEQPHAPIVLSAAAETSTRLCGAENLAETGGGVHDGEMELELLLATLPKLAHLAALDGLRRLRHDGCCELYERDGRAAFLARCKELGIPALNERQGLANAISKACTARRRAPSAE
jgi:hypothetical protein